MNIKSTIDTAKEMILDAAITSKIKAKYLTEEMMNESKTVLQEGNVYFFLWTKVEHDEVVDLGGAQHAIKTNYESSVRSIRA